MQSGGPRPSDPQMSQPEARLQTSFTDENCRKVCAGGANFPPAWALRAAKVPEPWPSAGHPGEPIASGGPRSLQAASSKENFLTRSKLAVGRVLSTKPTFRAWGTDGETSKGSLPHTRPRNRGRRFCGLIPSRNGMGPQAARPFPAPRNRRTPSRSITLLPGRERGPAKGIPKGLGRDASQTSPPVQAPRFAFIQF